MTNIPPELWTSLVSIILTLLVSAAHQRGHRLPLLEKILDVVHGQPRTQPTLQTILDELRRRLPEPATSDR
jgi:hypothetical protein